MGISGGRVVERLFMDLSSYGIAIVPHSYIVGHMQDGLPGLYIATARVQGTTLEHKLRHGGDTGYNVESIDDLFTGLLHYYKTKYHQGGIYLADLRTEQFMYDESGTDASIMLVDLDPYVDRLDNSQHKNSILNRISSLSFDLVTAEHCMGAHLTTSRLIFDELLESLSEEDRDDIALAL